MKMSAVHPWAITVAESMPTTPQRKTAMNSTFMTMVARLDSRFITVYDTVSPKPLITAEAMVRRHCEMTRARTHPMLPGRNTAQTVNITAAKAQQPEPSTAQEAVTTLLRSLSSRQSMRNRNIASSISSETAGTRKSAIVLM